MRVCTCVVPWLCMYPCRPPLATLSSFLSRYLASTRSFPCVRRGENWGQTTLLALSLEASCIREGQLPPLPPSLSFPPLFSIRHSASTNTPRTNDITSHPYHTTSIPIFYSKRDSIKAITQSSTLDSNLQKQHITNSTTTSVIMGAVVSCVSITLLLLINSVKRPSI